MNAGDSLFEIEGDPFLKSSRFLNFLLSLKGIGPAKALSIAQRFETLDQVFDHLASVGLYSRDIMELPELDSEYPIQAISFFSDSYPSVLRDLPNPPAILWVMGELPQGKTIAVIGTRNPSPEGIAITGSICGALDVTSHVLVSGLADGIDSIAHSATLENQIRNVAVLGHGFSEIWRSSKVDLAQQILDQGGALVSEYSPFTRSTQGSFVERDRIIASLSTYTVVIECGIPSGTLHTVREALNIERTVLVVDQKNKTSQNLGNQYLMQPNLSQLSSVESEWISRNHLSPTANWRELIIPVKTVSELRAFL